VGRAVKLGCRTWWPVRVGRLLPIFDFCQTLVPGELLELLLEASFLRIASQIAHSLRCKNRCEAPTTFALQLQLMGVEFGQGVSMPHADQYAVGQLTAQRLI
jgi:hypothetical protein